MATLTKRFDEAVRYARQVHSEQTRKDTTTPYIAHLLGVSSIVLDDGGNEDEAIAALLHEAAEDPGGRARLEDIRSRFGDAVAKVVEDCRVRAFSHARTLPPSSLRVSVADKVHNAYAILRELRNEGEAVWQRFSAAPDDVISYYQSLVRAYREAGGGKLVDELERIVRGIEREMGY
jgi:(p)ppGpp synthase/HD superfamily hydrolase